MTVWIPLADSPATGAAALDALSGTIAVLAGFDRAEAAAAFALYQSLSTRPGASWNSETLRITQGAVVLQFLWECSVSWEQDVAWTTVWTELAIENRLAPSDMLIAALNAIITAGQAA